VVGKEKALAMQGSGVKSPRLRARPRWRGRGKWRWWPGATCLSPDALQVHHQKAARTVIGLAISLLPNAIRCRLPS